MKRLLGNTNLFILLIVILSFILFLPGFFTYFHQDDFIHLSYSTNINQVLSSFNIFQKGEFPFYRPIPTQLYFFINKALFGLNPSGYHLFNFLIFFLNILLVYKLTKLITGNEIVAQTALVFFAINSTHFAPLYSPAYIHELLYVLFGLLTIINFLRNNKLSSISFFILSLMTKETAVILPGMMLLTYWFITKKKKINIIIKKMLPYFFILGLYLIGHFLFYGIASSPSYKLIFGKQNLNILIWYFLWALSTPNILIDFIGSGLKLSSVFLQISQVYGIIYFLFSPIFVLLGLLILYKVIPNLFRDPLKMLKQVQHDRNIQLIIFGITWFIVGMLPLIVFPLHKLATEQAFSLIGLSISLAVLLNSFINIPSPRRSASHTIRGVLTLVLPILFIITYLIIAVNSILLARKTHWIVISAKQAENVINFMRTNYPYLDDDAQIYFKNGEIKIAPYGSSRQLYQALGNGYGLKLVLNKPNLRLFFEDLGQRPEGVNFIAIDSSKLLGY